MRKFSLVIAVLLLTAPAWADVTITAEQDPQDPYRAIIKYVRSVDEPNLVRAFALDIKVTAGDANIIEVNDFTPGENNSGYGVYPSMFDAVINVDGDGQVTNWDDPGYTPEADPADDGTEPGLGTGGLTVEMGSLYPEGGNAPGDSGTLCSVKVDGECTVCVSLNAARGNIVMENALPPAGDVILGTGACVDLGAACPCPGDSEPLDGKNSAADMTNLMLHLFFNGGNKDNGWTANNPIPAALACMNLDETPSSLPGLEGQQVLSAADMTALMLHLFFNGGNKDNGWMADYCYGQGG
jgi:hypothetical protein